MATVTINCAWCGAPKDIQRGEHRRQQRKGRVDFFCSLSCSAKRGNVTRQNCEVTKTCPHCGDEFKSTSSVKAATFCSRSCASAGSVTEKRRSRAQEVGPENLRPGIETNAKVLRAREGWKYVKVAACLLKEGVTHQFEYPIEGVGIFDLALLDLKTLVEFDGPHHQEKAHAAADKEKDRKAEHKGWTVARVSTDIGVIPVSAIEEVLE